MVMHIASVNRPLSSNLLRTFTHQSFIKRHIHCSAVYKSILYLMYSYLMNLLLLTISILSISCALTVGISVPETTTSVTMQANPAYTAMEDLVVMESNPCYLATQETSGCTTIAGNKTGWYTACMCTLLYSIGRIRHALDTEMITCKCKIKSYSMQLFDKTGIHSAWST